MVLGRAVRLRQDHQPAEIAGLEEITSVRCGRRADHQRHPPKDRDIAMVFQSYALYPT